MSNNINQLKQDLENKKNKLKSAIESQGERVDRAIQSIKRTEMLNEEYSAIEAYVKSALEKSS